MSILEELLDKGFEVIFVGVFAEGLDKSWLGRRLDEEAIKELLALRDRYDISLVGEGGEYETLVLDAPLYKSRLELVDYEICWDGYTGVLKVLSARLVPK